jgi:hypothetical protein
MYVEGLEEADLAEGGDPALEFGAGEGGDSGGVGWGFGVDGAAEGFDGGAPPPAFADGCVDIEGEFGELGVGEVGEGGVDVEDGLVVLVGIEANEAGGEEGAVDDFGELIDVGSVSAAEVDGPDDGGAVQLGGGVGGGDEHLGLGVASGAGAFFGGISPGSVAIDVVEAELGGLGFGGAAAGEGDGVSTRTWRRWAFLFWRWCFAPLGEWGHPMRWGHPGHLRHPDDGGGVLGAVGG